MSGYNLQAGRTPAQTEKMKKLQAEGICAFCPEYFVEHHDNPIAFETKHWIAAKNDYPYEHTSLHLLLVAREHVQTLSQLSKSVRDEFLAAVLKVEKNFQLPSYSLGMRVGDFHYNGGSVDHLHAHIVVGERKPSNEHTAVRFKMSSAPKK